MPGLPTAPTTNRNDSPGMTRIDPRTNAGAIRVGDRETCGQGVFAFGSVWQPACAAHMIMRIDPTTFTSTNIDSANHWSAVASWYIQSIVC